MTPRPRDPEKSLAEKTPTSPPRRRECSSRCQAPRGTQEPRVTRAALSTATSTGSHGLHLSPPHAARPSGNERGKTHAPPSHRKLALRSDSPWKEPPQRARNCKQGSGETFPPQIHNTPKHFTSNAMTHITIGPSRTPPPPSAGAALPPHRGLSSCRHGAPRAPLPRHEARFAPRRRSALRRATYARASRLRQDGG